MTRFRQWDTRQPLDGAADRRIGVAVGRPFYHSGMKAVYMDIERETPRVNTTTWGNCYPIDELRIRTREAFNQTISELDQLIWHLAGHRDRLRAELETMPDRDFVEDVPTPEVKPAAEVPAVAASPVVDVHLPESA